MKIYYLSIFILFICLPLHANDSFFTVSEQVKKVLPSIVKIKVQQNTLNNDENELIAFDSGGSGFVLDNDHHIATNAHVVGDGKKIVVIDNHNMEYPAFLIAKDDKTDIAVLSAATFDAPALSESNSSTLNVGDGVFAIGSPYSLGHSVSLGIVSALDRFLPNYPYLRFIQIDAAINPGNSGGPLFNLNGDLIGMTSTYFSKQGGYTNIAFTIPIADVHRIAEQLIKEKEIQRGYIGAELLLSERISRKLGYKTSIFVSRVEPNSPAARDGLESGDIIIGMNNTLLNDEGELHRYLERSHPEDTVSLMIVRNKEEIVRTVTLGHSQIKKSVTTNISTADASEKLGLILDENSEEINVILSYGLSKMVGINPNDKIVEINGIKIKTIQELDLQLSRLKDTEIAILKIQRSNMDLLFPIGSKTALKGYSTQN